MLVVNASTLQMLGAGGLGVVVGWYVYYINRYRKSDIQMSDLLTLIGAIGGGATTALFPAKTDLFGAYGIGLFCGFFSYFLLLIILVGISKNFNVDWFLDGRRIKPSGGYEIPSGWDVGSRAMDGSEVTQARG
jgi:hypothetical protein